MKYYKELDKNTIERYSKKIDFLYEYLKKYINKYPISFEPFINVAYSKSVVNVKMAYKLKNENGNISEEHLLEMVINDGLTSIIANCLKKYEFNYHEFVYLSTYIKNDAAEILKIINNYKNQKFESDVDYRVNRPKYLLFGKNHIQYIDEIVGDVKLIEEEPYFWCEYDNLKLYYLPELKNIYLSNAPIVDFNNLKILFNDTLNADTSDLKTLPIHKGIVTLNSIIASKIDLVKIECSNDPILFKNYKRSLKLNRLKKLL